MNPQAAQEAVQQIPPWLNVTQLAVGFIAGVIVQLLANTYLEKYKADREYKRWLRDRKWDVYAVAMKILCRVGRGEEIPDEETDKVSNELSLLCQDGVIQSVVETFEGLDKGRVTLEEMEVKEMIMALKDDLHNTK